MMNYNNDVEAVEAFIEKYHLVKKEVARVIVGQDDVVRDVLIAIFSRSHALLVGVPGLAKTLMVTTIAKSIGLSFNRIQFTPDLMPSDIMGTEILDENRKLKFVKGPVFSNIILADEINRTPPKTQSALLEAMQERTVSIAGVTHVLPDPFFVLATQNPIEQEGTYPLPEAQLDRFMFNILLDYPSFNQEIDIVKSTITRNLPEPNAVMNSDEIVFFQKLMQRIPIVDNVYNYAVNLSVMSRPLTPMAHPHANQYLSWGAGPRASQNLIMAARCHALIAGKHAPDIEDIKAVAPSILRHRLVKNYKAEAEGISVDDIVQTFINAKTK